MKISVTTFDNLHIAQRERNAFVILVPLQRNSTTNLITIDLFIENAAGITGFS